MTGPENNKKVAAHDGHDVHESNGHGGHHSWKSRLLHIIHSDRVEAVMAFLLIIDILIVVVELYLTTEYPDCGIIQRDAFCCNGRGLNCAVEQQKPAGCDPHKHHDLHWIHEALDVASITILSLFLLELVVLVVVMGPGKFFSNVLQAAELIVVSISLVLELMPSSFVTSAAGLIVAGRLWRFVRIGHGIFETTHEFDEFELMQLEHYTQALEKLLKDQGIEIPSSREASAVESLRKKLEMGKKD